MTGYRLIAVCVLGLIAVGPLCAGPELDSVLDYMFMDQSVPMRGPQLMFYNEREIRLTRDTRIGQTFVTGPETGRVARLRVYFARTHEWTEGEGATITLWDSPLRQTWIGSDTLWYRGSRSRSNKREWNINADVEPNTEYYFEFTYAGHGDGVLGRVGVMKNPDSYKPGRGYLLGNPEDFDVCFQVHSRKPPDPIGNLKKTFARLHLDHPGLEKVKTAVESEDFETAIAETVKYFEGRTEPVPIIRPGDGLHVNPDADPSEADGFMRATWREVRLQRFGGRKVFLNAYQTTGRERYAKKLNDLLIEFYVDRPPPSESRIGGCPWDDAWNSLATGARTGHGFVAYSRLHTAKSFTTDCRAAYIFNLADHCNTLVNHGAHAKGNWSFTQNSSMLTFAMNFPEFKRWEVWRDTAVERLAKAIKEDILPDGVEMESAPSYQRMAYSPLARIYDDLVVKRGLKTPFSEELRENLERQAEYFMYLPMPSGVTPYLGDWAHEQQRHAIGADAARFNRSDMLYVATAGKKGTKPKELSKLYPYAGIVTMRSDWGDAGRPYDDARYILFHGVHFGAHGNQDINGISALYAYGRELLTDPGAHRYGSPQHSLLISAPSHNLMTIDGEDQDRNADTAFNNWSTTPVADYLSSWIDAYESGDYTRQVFYTRANGDPVNDYYVVRDRAGGTGTHSLEQRWRFLFGTPMQVDDATLTTTTGHEDGGNLAILQLDPSRLQIEETTTDTWLWRGQDTDPSKLPTVIYKTNTELPAAIDTVLFPFEGKQMPEVRLEPLETSPDGLVSAFKIVQGTVEDLFVLQKSASKKSLAAENVSFEGEHLFVRRVGGKLRSVLLVNGTSATVDGREVVRSDNALSWVAVSFDESGVKVFTSSEEPTVTVPAAGGDASVTNTKTDELIRIDRPPVES